MSEKSAGWMPLWVRTKGVNCLVVGGGQVALRKIRMLLETGASVQVVTREASPAVEEMAQRGLIQLRIKEADKEDLRGCRLVVVATDSRDVNSCVTQWAQQQGVLCNVVDKPELCTALFPAIIRKGRLEVAVSTGGSSPAMAARIRDHIAQSLDQGYEVLLDLLSEIRGRVKHMGLSEDRRLKLLRSLVDDQVIALCKEKKYKEMGAILESRLHRALQEDPQSGKNAPEGLSDLAGNSGEKIF